MREQGNPTQEVVKLRLSFSHFKHVLTEHDLVGVPESTFPHYPYLIFAVHREEDEPLHKETFVRGDDDLLKSLGFWYRFIGNRFLNRNFKLKNNI